MSFKVLGQVSPAATTDTTLYTVPAGKSCVISTLTVCNTGSAVISYRIAVRPGGASLTTAHYVAYDAQLPAASTDTLTLGITLSAGDVLTVRAHLTGVAFGAFGDET